MARGRKAQPAAVKEARGNPGRRPIRREAEAAVNDLAGYPDWLDVTRFAKADRNKIAALAIAAWRHLQGELQTLRLLKTTDAYTLGRFCQYHAEWVYATRVLAAEGYWYERVLGTGETAKLPHPAARMRRDAMSALKDLGDAMGLTPSARLRLTQQLAQGLPGGHQAGLPLESGDQAKDTPPAARREAGGEPKLGGEGPLRTGFLN